MPQTGYGRPIGKGKNLLEAIEVAEKEMEKEYVEYGIHFVGDKGKVI